MARVGMLRESYEAREVDSCLLVLDVEFDKKSVSIL